jgi:hypothetical protein
MRKGVINTLPTEKGKRDLDVFNPSYIVKYIRDEPIETFTKTSLQDNGQKDEFRLEDKFLEILRNVDAGLITLKIDLPQLDFMQFNSFMEQYYLYPSDSSPWNLMRKEALRVLLQVTLLPEMEKEIKVDLANISENLII